MQILRAKMEKCQIYFNNRFFLAMEQRANHVVFSEGLLAGAVPKAILILLLRVYAVVRAAGSIPTAPTSFLIHFTGLVTSARQQKAAIRARSVGR